MLLRASARKVTNPFNKGHISLAHSANVQQDILLRLHLFLGMEVHHEIAFQVYAAKLIKLGKGKAADRFEPVVNAKYTDW